MKKVILAVMSAVIGLSVASSSAFAEEKRVIPVNEEIELPNELEPVFTYEVNGIEFSGNVELTQEQLNSMYREATRGGIQVFIPDNGGSSIMEVPPVYRTYKNAGKKAAAELITAYIISKTPKPIRKATWGAWVLNHLSRWVDIIKPSYVGSWVSSSYSYAEKKRLYYNTLVHYKNKDYTGPTSVQYWESTAYWR